MAKTSWDYDFHGPKGLPTFVAQDESKTGKGVEWKKTVNNIVWELPTAKRPLGHQGTWKEWVHSGWTENLSSGRIRKHEGKREGRMMKE